MNVRDRPKTRGIGGSIGLALASLVCGTGSDSAWGENPPQSLATVGRPASSSNVDMPTSTVSPAIERFVRESGRGLAAPVITPPPISPIIPSSAERVLKPADLGFGLNPWQDPVGSSLPPALPTPPVPPGFSADGESPNQSDTSRLAPDPKIKPAPFAPEDRRYPINLATALRLADARPLIVATAQASVWVAEAELTRAKVLWVPSATFAVDYLRHDGGGPDFNKGIMTAPSTNFFYGGPALIQSVNLSDAIFVPLQARQVLNSRHWDVQTSKNDALLQTADAYFQVHQYRGNYAGALYTVERGRELVQRITDLSFDLANKVEIERAKNLLADLEQRAVLARQEWRVQSANLTQVLRLDPRAVVDPLEHDHTQITLIDPARTFDDLMPIALGNRPELASKLALIEAAAAGVKREKNRPLLPLVKLNGFQSPGGMSIQAGLFGLGPNSSLNQFTGRSDVSVQFVWQLEGLGFGNLARIKAQRGMQSQAVVNFFRDQDRVAAEVNRALARVQSAAARVLEADRALRSGITTFNGQIEGLGQTKRFGDVLVLVFRPQETIYSLNLLSIAFNEYFTTVGEYNRAQFELFHALGYPAREVTEFRPAGSILPVDTTRPAFLPPVGNGPPPATR